MVHSKKKVVGFGLAAAGFLITALLVAGAAMSGDGGLADDRIADMGVSGSGRALVASAVSSSIDYQGMLTDSSGNPLSGMYTMTFKLYETSTGGTALDTDTHSVTVNDGLVNTTIHFDTSFFDGRALWLEIQVGEDSPMTPRQELRPVPYALSLRPGAVINGSIMYGPMLYVKNTGTSNGQGVYAHTEGDLSYGVYARTDGDGSEGVYARTFGTDSEGVYARTSGNGSYGVYARTSGTESEGVYASTSGVGSEGVYGHTTGNDSPAVYGWSEKDVGVYGKGKEAGGYFTTLAAGTSRSNLKPGVNVSTRYNYNPGVRINTEGDDSRGVHAYTKGDYSEGFYAYTSGNDSEGFYAWTEGTDSQGVFAYTEGTDSPAVHGFSEKDVGVYGKGKEAGGYFTTTAAGTLANPKPGVNVSTRYNYNPGVYAHTSGDASVAVYGYSEEDTGVYGYSDRFTGGEFPSGGTGVYGEARSDTQDGTGVKGLGAYGVWGEGTYRGVYGESAGYAGMFRGNVVIQNYDTGSPVMELGEGLDYAEGFDVSDQNKITPGSVLCIDPSNPGLLTVCDMPYDRKVAGIVTGANGLNSGVRLRSDEFDYNVALAGRVYCNVDATETAVEPGDLLTTSATTGYAMKVTDYESAQGAILGKAMEPLEKGEKGQILVLVTLQ